jgi:hypothetical protein
MAYFDRGVSLYKKGEKEKACTDIRKSEELGYEQAVFVQEQMCQ